MAEVKIYRAAYKKSGAEDGEVQLSGWVINEGIDEVIDNLQVSGTVHSIIGWEEKILDTEPV